MPTVFGKLNLKDQNEIVVVNAPASFEPELASLDGVTVRRNASEVKAIDFSLAFVTKQPQRTRRKRPQRTRRTQRLEPEQVVLRA